MFCVEGLGSGGFKLLPVCATSLVSIVPSKLSVLQWAFVWSQVTVQEMCTLSCSSHNQSQGSLPTTRWAGSSWTLRRRCVRRQSLVPFSSGFPSSPTPAGLTTVLLVPPFLFPQAALTYFNLYLFLFPFQSLIYDISSRPCSFQVLPLWILKWYFFSEAWLLEIKCFGLKTNVSVTDFKIDLETKDLSPVSFFFHSCSAILIL